MSGKGKPAPPPAPATQPLCHQRAEAGEVEVWGGGVHLQQHADPVQAVEVRPASSCLADAKVVQQVPELVRAVPNCLKSGTQVHASGRGGKLVVIHLYRLRPKNYGFAAALLTHHMLMIKQQLPTWPGVTLYEYFDTYTPVLYPAIPTNSCKLPTVGAATPRVPISAILLGPGARTPRAWVPTEILMRWTLLPASWALQ
eukprot:SAG22_NODE_80_length_21788_cov_9.742542_14_plen_199_part_00